MEKENNFVIEKADKGNIIVILDNNSYLKPFETLWKDSSKFKNIHTRILHLKEVSQTDEIVVFPFISDSDVFDLSHVSLSELRIRVSGSWVCLRFFVATRQSKKLNRVGAQMCYVS